MVTMINGLPRQGKGYFTVKEVIVPTLQNTNQHIVTNVPIDVVAMNLFFGKDVSDRFTFLETRDAIKTFWKTRPFEKNITYIIDEAHKHFYSLRWKEISFDCHDYITTHAHLEDNVVFITQIPELMAKGLRDLVEKRYQVMNFREARLSGMRLGVKAFKVSEYWQGQKKPQFTYVYPFEMKYGNLYFNKGTMDSKELLSKRGDSVLESRQSYFKVGMVMAVAVLSLGTIFFIAQMNIWRKPAKDKETQAHEKIEESKPVAQSEPVAEIETNQVQEINQALQAFEQFKITNPVNSSNASLPTDQAALPQMEPPKQKTVRVISKLYGPGGFELETDGGTYILGQLSPDGLVLDITETSIITDKKTVLIQ